MSAHAVADVKIPVALTHASSEKISRHEMLRWVNTTVQAEYTKIEDLCSGVAYCQMMEMIFPHSVGLKKIKMNPKLEHEYVHNLKLFQMAFTRINYEKSVPIERLIKKRFQDNFEFLQWFKKFYDVHAAGKENLKVPITQKPQVPQAMKPAKKALNKDGGPAMTPPTANSTRLNEDEASTPKTVQALQETKEKLTEQTAILLNERNFYYNKLLEVEKVLKEFTDRSELCERAMAILYATDADIQSAGFNEPVCHTAEL